MEKILKKEISIGHKEVNRSCGIRMCSYKKKIKNFNDLILIFEQEKKKNKKIVLCHGCFDVLHIGHVWHFESAKKNGDILVVTVTPDKYVNKVGRPLFNENLRTEMIAAIEIVNFVAINLWPSAPLKFSNLRYLI